MLQRSALFSPDRVYRYRLDRTWDERRPKLIYIMLNPSVADDKTDDQTIRVCMGRAERLKFGGIIVLNLFGLISTKPGILTTHNDPIGPDNDYHIRRCLLNNRDNKVIAAWGIMGNIKNRDKVIRSFCNGFLIPLHVLKFSTYGYPCHPLRIPYANPLLHWEYGKLWVKKQVKYHTA